MQKRLILKGIIFALGFTISNASADSLFTRLESCTESTASINCSIVLADAGFLKDKASGERIYGSPDGAGVLESYWLYKTKHGYLFERQNYSSSKTKHWITFEYSSGNLIVDKVYSFSRSVHGPLSPSWDGYQCQMKTKSSLVANKLSFFEAVMKTVCGDTVSPRKLELIAQRVQRLDDLGLHIDVPVISGGGVVGNISYVFLGAEDPDIFNMLCLAGCGAEVGPAKSSYFGKVGKRLKIKFDFSKDGCGAQGAYRYESSGKSIDAEGCIDSRRMEFIEYGNSRNIVRASFAGEVDGNGYRGKWKSKNGDTKEYGFFLYPSPIY